MGEFKIQELLRYLNEESLAYTFSGDEQENVIGVCSLTKYRLGCITWVRNQQGMEEQDMSKIQLLILSKSAQSNARNKIFCENPRRIFFTLARHFYGEKEIREYIGKGTVLSKKVSVGKDTIIGSNCTIDGEITIGSNCHIGHNVTIIGRAIIEDRCEIQSGTVMGHDGFGYTEDESGYKQMIRHLGGVYIESDVFIGPNVVIDRGTLDDTFIGSGSRIDGLCFIAHNVQIGKRCVLICSSRLYGSCVLEDDVYVASGIVRNQCRIGTGAIVGMGAVVLSDVPAYATVVGCPAKLIKEL